MKFQNNLLSIVIPAFNEAATISDTLNKLFSFFEDKPFFLEIIVVNDGSSDETDDILKRYADNHDNFDFISRLKNRGKGYSIKEGIDQAKGDIIIFTDADLPYELSAMLRIVEKIENGAQLAIGSRHDLHSNTIVKSIIIRRILSKLLSSFIQRFYLPGIKDSQCGLKGFRGEIAKELFSNLKSEGFIFDVEILLAAREKGYRIDEIPVTLQRTRKSTLRLTRDSLRMLKELFFIKRNHTSN